MNDLEFCEIKNDAKNWKKLINEICDQDDRKYRLCEINKIVVTCPRCDGRGEYGYDRCCPPNPYICQICDGLGKVELKSVKK